MIRGFVERIDSINNVAIINTENHNCYTFPLELLPDDIKIDDFIIIDNGMVYIDPDNEINRFILNNQIEKSVKK